MTNLKHLHKNPHQTHAQWKRRALGAIHGINDLQADAIAALSLVAEMKGENPAIWHSTATYFGTKCPCGPCSIQ